MSFFKNIFKGQKKEVLETSNKVKQNLSLDQDFVTKFIENKGKFLYCSSMDEVRSNLLNIVKENNWDQVNCVEIDLHKILKDINVKFTHQLNGEYPLFTYCEYLIAENGSILFSSNQTKGVKISELSDHFVVFATTSQIVKTKGESLTGIKANYKGNIPSNIGAIKDFNPSLKGKDFMSYGNTNSKNLYLLLFEDL